MSATEKQILRRIEAIEEELSCNSKISETDKIMMYDELDYLRGCLKKQEG